MRPQEQRNTGAGPGSNHCEGYPRQTLTLFDSASIIVGTIIGAGVYETLPLVAQSMGSLPGVLAIWLAGAAVALIGALCYAELAGMFPLEGGDYVYLTKSFGARVGFLFAWSELWIVRPGNTGAMAYVFARYANQIVPLHAVSHPHLAYAMGAIGVLTLVNCLGAQSGKWTQNVLTTAKVAGLLAVFGLAFSGPAAPAAAERAPAPDASYALAMILVMFTYGGWSDVAYVAGEIQRPRITILRALLVGLSVVAGVYLAANLAFHWALGFDGFRRIAEGTTAAAEVARLRMGERGVQFVSGLICLTTLGAINAQIFTSARVYYALGRDHPRLALLGRWEPTLGSPLWALLAQAAVTLPLVLGLGLKEDPFSRFVALTSPVFWSFFLLVGLSLFRLRWLSAALPRPFRVPGYPVTPVLFCLASLGMAVSSVNFALSHWSEEGYWVLAITAVGIMASIGSQPNATSGPKR